MKKHLIVIAVLVVIAAVLTVIFGARRNAVAPAPVTPMVSETPAAPEPIAMCYWYEKPTTRGLFDRAWLHMNITGTNVTGEYRNLPAEKDSKIGTFTGTVGPMNPATSSRLADVWWNSMAEGMTVTEQLHIQFGEGSAAAMFGVMSDRGDGTYVYQDIAQLTPGFQMSQTDCGELDQRIARMKK